MNTCSLFFALGGVGLIWFAGHARGEPWRAMLVLAAFLPFFVIFMITVPPIHMAPRKLFCRLLVGAMAIYAIEVVTAESCRVMFHLADQLRMPLRTARIFISVGFVGCIPYLYLISELQKHRLRKPS